MRIYCVTAMRNRGRHGAVRAGWESALGKRLRYTA